MPFKVFKGFYLSLTKVCFLLSIYVQSFLKKRKDKQLKMCKTCGCDWEICLWKNYSDSKYRVIQVICMITKRCTILEKSLETPIIWLFSTFRWDNSKNFMRFVIYIEIPTSWAQPRLCSSNSLGMASKRTKALF